MSEPVVSNDAPTAGASAPTTPPTAGRVVSLRDVNPRLLRCFVALAEELHFGRAASRLYVAQPALSRSIQQLERTVDRQLFVRTTRSVELTPAGQRMLPAVREALDSMSALIGDLAAAHRTLRVAHTPGTDTLALLLDGLVVAGSELAVQESTMGGADQLDALVEGRLDVAICHRPPAADGRFQSELVRLDPLLVAVMGRDTSVDRPVDIRKRTAAVGDGGRADREFSSFVAGYERATGSMLRRVPIAPGSGAEAYALRRAGATAFVRLASHGAVRLDRECPAVGAMPLQAYFPWAVVWRRGERSPAVMEFIETAKSVANARGWRDLAALPGEPWIPGVAVSAEGVALLDAA